MRNFILLLVIIIVVIPLALVVSFSVFSYYRYPLLFPEDFTLDFWRNIFTGSQFFRSLATGILVGVLNGFWASVIGIMTARALVRYKFVGSTFLKAVFSLPLFIPSIALFVGVHLMMIRLGLINSYLGVVVAHMIVSIPYATSIFISFFRGIDPEIEDTARILGCSQTGIYIRILLPLLSPAICFSFSISFLISFSEYFSTFLIGGGKIMTLATMFYPYVHNGDIGNGAVLAIVFILINILVFFLADLLSRKKIKIDDYLFE